MGDFIDFLLTVALPLAGIIGIVCLVHRVTPPSFRDGCSG